MRKHLGTVAVVAALVAVPAVARAQAHGGMGGYKHEFGVDIGLGYAHTGSGCTANCGSFNIGTPVDVRVGLVSAGSMMWEPRFTFSFSSGGGTFINFDPGVNVLFKMGQGGTYNHNKYFTVGADANIISNSPTGGTSSSGVVLGINGAVGMRSPWGSAASRIEAGVGYKFQNTTLGAASTLLIGARVGLSLWH